MIKTLGVLFLVFLKYLDYRYLQVVRYYLGLRKKKLPQQIELYRRRWLDAIEAKHYIQIRSPKEGVSIGPRTFRDNSISQKVSFPSIRMYSLCDITFNITFTSFIFERKIFIERVHGVESNRCNYPVAIGQIGSGGLAFIPRYKTYNLPKGIFLGGNGASNFYHWMIEILPKMEFVNELGCEFAEWPIFVSESVRDHSSFHDALDIFLKGRPIIYLDNDKYYTSKKLIVFTNPSNVPFNLGHGESPLVEDFLTSPRSVSYVRQKILARYSLNKPLRTRRIFLSLERSRRKYNAKEVFEILERFGFESVLMDKLNLKQQVELMQEAEFLVGPTGAMWTNLIFCSPDTRCLCWMDRYISQFSCFSNLAHLVQADLYYFFYESCIRSTSQAYTADYVIDLNELELALTNLVEQPGVI